MEQPLVIFLGPSGHLDVDVRALGTKQRDEPQILGRPAIEQLEGIRIRRELEMVRQVSERKALRGGLELVDRVVGTD